MSFFAPDREPDELEKKPAEEPKRPYSNTVGLRIAVYFLAVFMAMSFSVVLLYGLLAGPEAVEKLTQVSEEPGPDPVLFLWLRAASAPVALLITLLFLRFFDGRSSIREIGFVWPRSAGVQALLAVLLAAIPLGSWLLLSDPWVESTLVTFTDETAREMPGLPLGATGFASLALAFLIVAFVEELIFRGYIFSTFRERFSWVNAAGLSNLLYVAQHTGHPDIGAAGLINYFLLGLSACAMREKSGSIWMSTVFSGLWNVLLACGLSLPVMGSLFPRLFDHSLVGPVNLTGGEYGPVNSWLLTAPLILLVVGLAAWAERNGESGEVAEKAPAQESAAVESTDS